MHRLTLYKLLVALFILCAAIQWSDGDAAAKGRGGSSYGSGITGPVGVGVYFKRNGTYVAPHHRSLPQRGPGIGRHPVGGRRGWGGSVHSRHDEGTYRSGYRRVERSQSARMEFLRRHGYYRLPTGYEIDHIVPLSQGGSDTPDNMQLLTVEDHHRKTARERKRY